MEKKNLFQMLLPIILFILMLVDAQISTSLRLIVNNHFFLSSHFLLFGLIIGCLYYSKKYMVIVAIGIGLLYDVYYYSIIGLNMVSLPLTVLLMYLVFDYVRPTLLTLLLGLVVFITIMDSSVFVLQKVFNLINANGLSFITNQLGPTLLMNIVVFIVLAFPLKRVFKAIY